MISQASVQGLDGTDGARAVTRTAPRRGLGAAAIALAVAINIPFSILGATFDYPAVLRRPAAEVLTLYSAGGPALVLTWHAFALCALALVPFAFAFALTPARLAARPGLAVGAAVAGALSGLAQAIGLWRWVFVVPGLAHTMVDPAASAEAKQAAAHAFDLINQYGGVAIGEHIGQTLLTIFLTSMAALQWAERARIAATIGLVSAAVMLAGTGEGLAMALGQDGSAFGVAAIFGFLGLTLWLIASGIGLWRGAAVRK